MRFCEDGPEIPDALIEARDLGEVVFFCGAGISAPAGLPDFAGLADNLLAQFTAQDSQASRARGDSLDRVFTAMIKEFGGEAVDAEMGRALRTPRGADLRFHQAAIDLSRGADGAAKVVTTNFDLLFERADRALQSYVPPALPDLAQLQPIQGVVYLHGRLARVKGRRAGYVISSADFGRAYLAEGWAARFVRALRERYTIVLLGYSADDPPMRYLLEGLNSRENASYRTQLYAFAPEGSAATDEAWRDKGVTTIPYAPRDCGHGGLWDTLFAWAEAARNPEAWRSKLVRLAQSPPAELRPFERGQVAHLVSHKAGAAAFASAVPPPVAEWLCVFDAYVRYSKPGKRSWHDEDPEIDPLALYGLDGDPPRPAPRAGSGIEAPGEDLLRWRRGDQDWPERQRLSGFHVDWASPLSGRLFQLSRWFGSVLNQPTAIWWAARNTLPHPGLLTVIRDQLDRSDGLHPVARHFWQCYVEACRSRTEDLHDARRFELSSRIKNGGWNASVLRELARIITPRFAIEPAILSGPTPPVGDLDTLNLSELVEITVTVSDWLGEELTPPPEILEALVVMTRQSLLEMAAMLSECTTSLWRTPTLHPTGERGESLDPGRKSGLFVRFKALFQALVAKDQAAARREVAAWNSSEPIFFAKLFLFAAWVPGLLDAHFIAARILALPSEVFWEPYAARELLFALRAQWAEFSPRERRKLEMRIIAGPPQWQSESTKEFQRRRASRAACWLRWLELNDKVLTAATKRVLPRLIQVDPRFEDSWAWNADDSHSGYGGYVERVTEPQGLEKSPLRQLVALATSLSTDDHRSLRDFRPFDGVVGSAPFRALAALRIEARQGRYPLHFWRSLLTNWPETSSARLKILLGLSLARLPAVEFAALTHDLSRWAQMHIADLIKLKPRAGLAVFDAIVARYMVADADVLESGVGFSTIGGVPQEVSHVSVMKAINAPGGKLARVLLDVLGKPTRQRAMPAMIGSRLNRLLALPGHGAGHVACVLASYLSFLQYWFEAWVATLLPGFVLDHPLAEALWHGVASDGHFFSSAGRIAIKPAFLALLKGEAPFALDKNARERLMENLAIVTYATPPARPVVSFAEARRVLMAVSDEDRARTLGPVVRLMERTEFWSSYIKPFILNAWPRQLRYQSGESSRQIALLAEKAGDLFPEVVDTIIPFIRPIAHLDTFAYRIRKQDEEGHGYSQRFPAETLRLLDAMVGADPQNVPWNLNELLNTIASARPALRQSDPWRRLSALTQ
jgi:hypothetical protein